MYRIVAASVAVVAAALAVGPSAHAFPPTLRSSGMAAEFPIGRCLAVPIEDFDVDVDNLLYVSSVPCTDPARDYRVAEHVAHAEWCGPATNRVFMTRDVVALCVVQDYQT